MNTKQLILTNLFSIGIILPVGASFGQGNDQAKAKLHELRQRLASLKVGMHFRQVVKVMGKPDEVRHVANDGRLDVWDLLGFRD